MAFLSAIVFGPCFLGFEVAPNLHVAQFTVDATGPRGASPIRLLVEIKSSNRVKTYADGAQLYACRLAGPSRLAPYAAGRCQRLGDDFRLTLFHHTNGIAYSNIILSNELWATAWNLQGSRRLKNIGYTYFTSLPKIKTADDLSRIAMASNGMIQFQTTSTRPLEQVLDLKVYRESTTQRTSTLEVGVASEALAPPHLLLHPLVHANPAYYEVVNPEIYRIGLVPSAKLAIPRRIAIIKPGELKRFDYIVLGDASKLDGLAAPFDEEETDQIMHLERLDGGLDLFEFWRAHENSDQMSDRVFERRELEDR